MEREDSDVGDLQDRVHAAAGGKADDLRRDIVVPGRRAAELAATKVDRGNAGVAEERARVPGQGW